MARRTFTVYPSNYVKGGSSTAYAYNSYLAKVRKALAKYSDIPQDIIDSIGSIDLLNLYEAWHNEDQATVDSIIERS